ncbi:hypothetical protein [Bacillus testis]|uniref:hypothetical protein n=1 Tax=Bacillus testis TaxID=1622072 RepID=UPI00067F4853|nr:hypothetical protein [Bacillus testis]
MLNIMTIIEMDHSEVEHILDASFVFVDETVYKNVVHTCVDGFLCNKSQSPIDTDDAMEQLFLRLKAKSVIPDSVQDFSYELASCERIRPTNSLKEEPLKTIAISFTETK